MGKVQQIRGKVHCSQEIRAECRRHEARSWKYPKIYPPEVSPGLTIQSRSAARRAAQDLVVLKGDASSLPVLTFPNRKSEIVFNSEREFNLLQNGHFLFQSFYGKLVAWLNEWWKVLYQKWAIKNQLIQTKGGFLWPFFWIFAEI